jgi:Fe-S cluster assembly iron-binding protein IscA
MALDEPTDDDNKLQVSGLNIIVSPLDDEIIRSSGGLTVDYIKDFRGEGFSIRVGEPKDCGDCSCD